MGKEIERIATLQAENGRLRGLVDTWVIRAEAHRQGAEAAEKEVSRLTAELDKARCPDCLQPTETGTLHGYTCPKHRPPGLDGFAPTLPVNGNQEGANGR